MFVVLCKLHWTIFKKYRQNKKSRNWKFPIQTRSVKVHVSFNNTNFWTVFNLMNASKEKKCFKFFSFLSKAYATSKQLKMDIMKIESMNSCCLKFRWQCYYCCFWLNSLLRAPFFAPVRVSFSFPNIWQICAHVSNTNTYRRLPFKHPMFHFRHKSIIAKILFGLTCSYSLRDLYDFYR